MATLGELQKMKNKIIKLFLTITALFTVFATPVFAQDSTLSSNGSDNKVNLYFFWANGCPHCSHEKEFLKELEQKYPDLKIHSLEVTQDKRNIELLKNAGRKLNANVSGVPFTVIGKQYFIGYNKQSTGTVIEEVVQRALQNGCHDVIGSLITPITPNPEQSEEKTIPEKIDLPLVGEMETKNISLPVLTIIIGALDGFNPCAMWVLLFLITLLLNVRSRKRMYLIGGTFILASGIVYYLILVAWLKLFLAISYVNLTRILIGVLAMGLGVWQIKNFINYQPGTCKVTDGKQGFQEKIKNGLKNHAEKLVLSPLNLGIIGGIILLALGVNLVEFFCSAGLPAIYTRILSLNNVSNLSYHFYLLLYTFVFMLDDLIIFSLAFFTLSKLGFTEKYNYWATLAGGLLTLILGILLIFKPEFLMFF